MWAMNRSASFDAPLSRTASTIAWCSHWTRSDRPCGVHVVPGLRPVPARAGVSVGEETSVDDHFGSGGEAGVIRCEEGDGSGDLADVGAAAHRRLGDHAAFFLVLVHWGADPARADGIDADAVGASSSAAVLVRAIRAALLAQ